MQKSLKDFNIGESGNVLKLLLDGRLKKRLYDMGITPSVKIKLVKVAPLGDPIQISLRGYDLTLRKDDAQFILMEVE
ncbi:MAG: ferrous iron transport protein A [Clostridia bacterium]